MSSSSSPKSGSVEGDDDGGTRVKEEEEEVVVEPLRKNSSISCTIDDLQLDEGLLVVSFSHKDNLYQGVLLQLNRERGIPAGISFPKDYFSAAADVATTEPEKIATPVPQPVHLSPPPVHQRNTYFQESDHGTPQRALRRIIKPPARFKNSRMSLRPVQRPVLCAKCGDLCNDKIARNNNNDSGSQSEEALNPKKNGESKKSLKSSGVGKSKDKDPKRRLPVLTASTPLDNNKMNDDDNLPPPVLKLASGVEDPLVDYNYEGMGSHGIIDNAWRRPLAKPLRKVPSPSQSTLPQHKTGASRRKRKRGLPSLASIGGSNPAMSGDKIVQTRPVFGQRSSSGTGGGQQPPDLDARVKNLNLFIKRLTLAQVAAASPKQKGTSALEKQLKMPPLIPMPSLDPLALSVSSASGSSSSTHLGSLKVPTKPLVVVEDITCSAAGSEVNSGNAEKAALVKTGISGIPSRKRKMKLKRRNSSTVSVPYRFRDRTKKSPSWRLRRLSTMSNPDSRTTTADKDNSQSQELDYSVQDQELLLIETTKDSEDRSESNSNSRPHNLEVKKNPRGRPKSNCNKEQLESQLPPLLHKSSFSSVLGLSLEEVPVNNSSAKPLTTPESDKTPVIKIKLGSSGNGVVLQIPSKKKCSSEDDNNSFNSAGGSCVLSQESASESKALRKAMKKAKKEAKKKNSHSHTVVTPQTNVDSISVESPPEIPSPSSTSSTPPPLLVSSLEPSLPPFSTSTDGLPVNKAASVQHSNMQLDSPQPRMPVLHSKVSAPKNTTSHIDGDPEMLQLVEQMKQQYLKLHNCVEVLKKKKKKSKRRRKEKVHAENECYHDKPDLQQKSDHLTIDTAIDATPSLKLTTDNNTSAITSPNPKRRRNNSSNVNTLSHSQKVLTNASQQQQIVKSETLMEHQADSSTPHRVGISLKRVKSRSNSYIPWSCNSINSSDELSTSTSSSDSTTPLNKCPLDGTSESKKEGVQSKSLQTYNHGESNHEYKKGDVVWGKSTGLDQQWWPGKIVDILIFGSNEASAKVAWFNVRSKKQPFISFTDLYPFLEYYDVKYIPGGEWCRYQQAVQEAIMYSSRQDEKLQDLAE